jgi:PBP1b-binding outer membrane lipoprotein LpoB
MKKNIAIIIILSSVLFFNGCSKKENRKDINSVAEMIVSYIHQKDTASLSKLFTKDTSHGAYLTLIFKINKKKYFHEKFEQWPKQMTPEKEKLTFINIDTSEFAGDNTYSFTINYKVDTSYYSLSGSYLRDSLGNISIAQLWTNPTNLTDNCIECDRDTYKPANSLRFGQLSYITDYLNKTFESGQIKVKNDTDADINFIKFRVTLEQNGDILFSQTVETTQKVHKGDISVINIPEMSNYYTGTYIERQSLTLKTEILEVKPKAECEDCTKLKTLKTLL